MYPKFKSLSSLRKVALGLMLASATTGFAQIDSYEIGDMGYLRTPMETANGIVLTNSEYSELYSVDGDQLVPILKAPNCGLYTNLSKDGRYIGFKSFNDADEQAPAILDVTTGVVTVLEDYVWECGQPSFADDGTIAYTMGNNLIIRKGNNRKAFDLGFYTNIANISPDGTQVAYSNIDGRSFLINITTGSKELLNLTDGYRAIWSPDGSKMAIHSGTGGVFVRENASKLVYDLGKVESVSWANNSSELIITRLERVNDFEIKNSSIKRINFDGSGEITLVTASDNFPTDAIITSDNRLLIPYKTGAKRGLMMKKLVEGITPSAASVKEETIVSIAEEDVLGLRYVNPNDNPNIKPSPVPAEGTIGALDIPYYSQIYDSPAVNGCTAHGHVTCAPTSACMFLGYYDLLPQKTTYRRSDNTALKYAHCISAVFTNKAGTKTFNETAYGNGCYNVPGAYGYMWTGSRAPSGGYMTQFMKYNGCPTAEYLWAASDSWSKFCTESAAGRPSPLCVYLRSSGHLILGFRTNCYYRTSEGGFVAKNGCFVCHDPYGDANDSTWADDDGQHSSYDWIGYNSGRRNIGTYCWSVYATVPANTTPVEAKITSDPSEVTFKGVHGSTTPITTTIKITGVGLSSAISVASATSAITVAKASGWNDLTGGTLNLTLNTNYSQGMGEFSSYIAAQSGKIRLEIPTQVTLTDENGNIPSKEEPVVPDDTPEDPGTTTTPTTDVVSGLTEVWNYSDKSGKTANWINNDGQVTQDMAFANGKLYVVHRNASNSDNKIYIVDAYTGAKTGELPTSSCTTGIYYLSSVETIGGKVIACNLQTSATGALVVYKWDSDTSEPTELLNTTNRPSDMARIGDAMSISGDLTNGKIWFGFGSNAFYYKITNGVCSDSPTTIALTKDNAAFSFMTSPAVNFFEESDGSFWVASKDKVPMHFSSTGAYIEEMNSGNVNLNGSDAKFITLGTKKYAAATTYLNTAASSDGKTLLMNGAFTFFDATSDNTASSIIGKYPSAGLGANGTAANDRNTSFRSSICTEVNNTDLNVWILIPFQGAAYYKFQHSTTSGVDDIFTEEAIDAPVEYYNLQGMKVANPQGGIFIKVQGNKVTKEYIK